MRGYIAILIIAFLFFCKGVSAQSIEDTIQIREVSVLGKKSAQEIGILATKPDSMAFKNTQSLAISELISKYSPIFIKSYGQGATATASFRGTGPSHTQVLWNGMNLNSPMRGAVDLSQLPVFFIEEAVIYHGGSSMKQGSGGLGGAISLQNKPNWGSELSISGLLEKASFHSNKYFFDFQAGSKKVRSATRFFYEGSENDFVYQNYGVLPHRVDTQKNAAYWKAGILQEIYFRPVENQLFIWRAWYQKGNRDLPQLMSYEGGEREEYQDDQAFKTQFSWKNYNGAWNPQFFSGLNITKLDYYRNNPGFEFVIADSESKEFSFVNQFSVNHNFTSKASLSLRADFNYHKVDIEDKVDLAGYEKTRFEGSFMADLHLKTAGNFVAMFLLHPEFYDQHVVLFAPLLGLEWAFGDKSPFLFQSTVSRNFHKPNLNDLYWLPGGNPGLKPEDGYAGDLSVSFAKEKTHVKYFSKLAVYAAKINNWIVWQPAANGAYYWEAANLKEVFSRGAEYQGHINWKMGETSINVSGNYAYTLSSNQNANSSIDHSRGKQLIYTPKHTGNLFFDYSGNGFSANYSISYTGKRYTTSSNETHDFEQILNPYWLHNLSIKKNIHMAAYDISVKCAVNNLWDIDYQGILWRAMPGRNYSFTLGFNYQK